MLTAATYILLAGQTEAQATGNAGKLVSAFNLQLRNETDPKAIGYHQHNR